MGEAAKQQEKTDPEPGGVSDSGSDAPRSREPIYEAEHKLLRWLRQVRQDKNLTAQAAEILTNWGLRADFRGFDDGDMGWVIEPKPVKIVAEIRRSKAWYFRHVEDAINSGWVCEIGTFTWGENNHQGTRYQLVFQQQEVDDEQS